MSEVDEFVKENVLPEFQDLAEMVRELMRKTAPKATEEISYGLPMWIGTHVLAWISPNRQGITFGFKDGAYFDDPYDLLKGKGKHARHVKLKSVEAANKKALRHYIKQALERDPSE